MNEIKSATYRVAGGYDIHLRETGSGPAVVFIHGSGPGASGLSNFRENIAAFVAAGYRVILPDMIGYGASSKPEGIDYTLVLFTETLFEALKAHGLQTAALVGNSLGGGVAIQIALDHPEFVERLVLMAPGCIAPFEVYAAMPGISRMRSSFGEADFDLNQQKQLILNLVHPNFASAVPDALVAERFAVARTQPKDVLSRMRTPDLSPRLSEIDKPLLILWGCDDEFCPETHSRMFLERCSNVRSISFAHTGHWVQLERRNEFNHYAIGFLHDHR
jgi:4,5:9,10-diseco-3-hydroxy-5,9,17-trioxoandrosta-1(10),2-diene-4-oate hydrolase